ncbi:glycosyltransferase family 9 protein [Nitrolancea hollandica]|uniref:glycosyltransferase family 9 protein n=1 Tax=Nitrolancea hollandica TaxID=1206749 RepID=UPI0002FF6B66|nr:glycosyltransferase family 9 protein [Nitrolancea hollandica]
MASNPLLPQPGRILLVKLADLGDALLTTPAIRALHQTFPKARIDALTTPAGAAIYELVPDIDRIIRFPKELFDRPTGLIRPWRSASIVWLAARLRASRYDAVVLFHHLTTTFGTAKLRALCLATGAPVRAGLDNGRGGFLTHRANDYGFGERTEWQYYLDIAGALGAGTAETRPAVAIPDKTNTSGAKLLGDLPAGGPVIVIHPSVGWYSQARAWPVKRFAEVARRLQNEHQARIVLVGASDTSEAAAAIRAAVDAIDLTGRTSVAELAAVLRRADLVIGADSGVAHLAAAVEAPLLTIFGPSNHDAWRPYGAAVYTTGDVQIPNGRALVVRSGIACSPCIYTGFSLGRPQGCALRTCLDLVPVDEVVRVAGHILSGPRNARSATAHTGKPTAR